MRIEFKDWPSGAIVSTPGQVGPEGVGGTGWYGFGWSGAPNVLPRGDALFFIPDSSASPDYTESTWLARGAKRVEGPEYMRVLRTLSSRGLLIGRPNTQYKGWRVVGELGPLTDEHDRSAIPASELVGGGTVDPITGAASATGQTWQWNGNNWQSNNNRGGASMGNGMGSSGFDWMQWNAEQTAALLWAQHTTACCGAGGWQAPTAGTPAADYYAAPTASAGEATAASLAVEEARATAREFITKSYYRTKGTVEFLARNASTVKAFMSGDQMAGMMAMMAQQTAILLGGGLGF